MAFFSDSILEYLKKTLLHLPSYKPTPLSSYSLNMLIGWIPSKHHGHNFCVKEMVIEMIVLLQSYLSWSLMIRHSATASFFSSES